jgi:hypothetical protein
MAKRLFISIRRRNASGGDEAHHRDVKARAVVAALKRPIRTAVGTMPSAPLVLIDVTTEEGGAERSYIFGRNIF